MSDIPQEFGAMYARGRHHWGPGHQMSFRFQACLIALFFAILPAILIGIMLVQILHDRAAGQALGPWP